MLILAPSVLYQPLGRIWETGFSSEEYQGAIFKSFLLQSVD